MATVEKNRSAKGVVVQTLVCHYCSEMVLVQISSSDISVNDLVLCFSGYSLPLYHPSSP